MSRIRIRSKALVAALLVAVTAFGTVAPVAGAASAGPSKAILRAIL
jgi:hypothetical protein